MSDDIYSRMYARDENEPEVIAEATGIKERAEDQGHQRAITRLRDDLDKLQAAFKRLTTENKALAQRVLNLERAYVAVNRELDYKIDRRGD